MNNTNIYRNNSIDALRFFAALGVVFSHALNKFEFYGFGGKLVDVFFVISGFVIFYGKKNEFDALKFMQLRFFRIYPKYLIASVLAVIGYKIIGRQSESNDIIRSIFLFPNPNGEIYYPVLMVGWSLCFEIFFYLKYAILRYFSNKFLLINFFCVTVIFYILEIYSLQTFIYVLEFCFGGVVGTIYLTGSRVKYPRALFILGILFYSFSEYMVFANYKYSEVVLLISAVIMVACVDGIGRLNTFSELGRKYSYEIYLFHPIFMTAIYWFLPNKDSITFSVMLVLSLVFPVVFTILLHRVGVR
jgi:exopolysaccharide production protein ExoZ